MAARNRPRNGAIKEDATDAHEEMAMWEQIRRDIEKLSEIQKRQKENSTKIIEMEEKMGKCTCLVLVACVCSHRGCYLTFLSCCCLVLPFPRPMVT